MITAEEVVFKKTKGKLESYGFAKRHGILIVDVQEDYVKAIYHGKCTPQAIIELRRFLDLPLQLEEVTPEEFTLKLTNTYEVKAQGAFQVAEDMGEGILKAQTS